MPKYKKTFHPDPLAGGVGWLLTALSPEAFPNFQPFRLWSSPLTPVFSAFTRLSFNISTF